MNALGGAPMVDRPSREASTERTSRRSRAARLVLIPLVAVTLATGLVAVNAAPAHAAMPSVVSKIVSLANASVGSGCDVADACGGQWCAKFAIWVWQRAGVDVTGLDAYAHSFSDHGYGPVKDTPAVGDAIVFSDTMKAERTIEHVAIVVWVSADGKTISSVGGNEGDPSRVVLDQNYSSAVGSRAPAPIGWLIWGYVSPATPAGYYPLWEPARIMKSANPVGLGGVRTFTNGQPQVLNLYTYASLPDSTIAVTGTVTTFNVTGTGYITVAPSLASSAPATSTVSVKAGENRSAGVTVGVSDFAGSRTIAFGFWGTGSVDVIFDLTGYFTNGKVPVNGGPVSVTGGDSYVPLPDPVRAMAATTLVSQNKKSLSITTNSALLAMDANIKNAVAVTGNVTVVRPSAKGYVTVAPNLTSFIIPPTSTNNFPAGDIRAANTTVGLNAGGGIDLMYLATSGASTQVIFDVTGYFVRGSGGKAFHAFQPYRAVDSRYDPDFTTLSSQGVSWALIATNNSGQVPTGAVAVTGNITVAYPTAAGYVTVGPLLWTGTVPNTSTINFPALETRANGVTAKLTSAGTLGFLYWAEWDNHVDVIFDVTGYFK